MCLARIAWCPIHSQTHCMLTRGIKCVHRGYLCTVPYCNTLILISLPKEIHRLKFTRHKRHNYTHLFVVSRIRRYVREYFWSKFLASLRTLNSAVHEYKQHMRGIHSATDVLSERPRVSTPRDLYFWCPAHLDWRRVRQNRDPRTWDKFELAYTFSFSLKWVALYL